MAPTQRDKAGLPLRVSKEKPRRRCPQRDHLVGGAEPFAGYSKECKEGRLGSGTGIGDREKRHVRRSRTSLAYIDGFDLHNDYSERSFQLERGGQWVKGKSADTFAPLGAAPGTVDEVPNAGNLYMWLRVNGELRQNSSTANMIFDCTSLVSYVSEFVTLLPGDVISTGTSAEVGLGMNPPQYLKAGDLVELGIEGLGESRQQVIDLSEREMVAGD
jgi:2-keto-4-pentenoate hydratase/2-oxohepta-3-ene-1,7-dioic acid hydratase in catechol pathway